MKTDHEMIRVKLENMNARLVAERECLKERLTHLEEEIQVNQQLLAVLTLNKVPS